MKSTGEMLRRFRALCLAFPKASETSSWGHPNFRVGKRTFATFEIVEGRPSIAFLVGEREAGLLLRRKHFFSTPYGRGQWVSIWADSRLNWRLIADLLGRSYRLVAVEDNHSS